MDSTDPPQTIDREPESPLRRGAGEFGMLVKKSMPLILVWPLVCLLLGTLLWASVLSKLDADRRAMEKTAQREASSLSKAYAQHLTRAI